MAAENRIWSELRKPNMRGARNVEEENSVEEKRRMKRRGNKERDTERESQRDGGVKRQREEASG